MVSNIVRSKYNGLDEQDEISRRDTAASQRQSYSLHHRGGIVEDKVTCSERTTEASKLEMFGIERD